MQNIYQEIHNNNHISEKLQYFQETKSIYHLECIV